MIKLITEKLLLDWSPEQISGRLKKEGISISIETIYQFVLKDKKEGGTLYQHLRWQKKRRKRYGSKAHDKRGQIKDKISIDKRPKIVDQKTRIGDWEGDLIIGKNHKGAMFTGVERKTKITRIIKLENKNAKKVARKTCRQFKKEKIYTMTFDNGKEFTEHQMMAKTLKADIFFAHPYSSYERGLNENTNGLIRQYFPKKSSFEKISKKDIAQVEDLLNNRPRKSLNYSTPNEMYYKPNRR